MAGNALMDRMPMRGAPMQQMAAAPQEPPPNALMQGRGRGQPQQPDPMMMFMDKAKSAGIDIDAAMKGGGDQMQIFDQAMKAIWAREPTDDNGEMIESLSQQLGLPPPWQQGDGKMMKLGGPQEEDEEEPLPNARLSRSVYEEMTPQKRGFANPELAAQYGGMTEAMESETPGARAHYGVQRPLSRYRALREKTVR